jgi:xylose isomerase
VGNIGRDPFGEPVRWAMSPVEIVHLLAEVGAYGVNFHDNDLVPIDASPAERDRIVRNFKQALEDTGLVVPMATTNLFTDPAFKDGAFTSNDPTVRAYALHKTLRAIDLGVELGAKVYVFWGGREGVETDAAKDPVTAIQRNREAMNFVCEYAIDQGYDLKFALEAKPNEPRGDMYNATTGHMLAFIATLDHPEMVGVNPEVAHEHMAASTSCTTSPRPGRPASCSTSTSTTRPLAATTRTSASARSTSSRPSSWSSSWRMWVTPAAVTSTPTPTAPRTTRASRTSPAAACAPT